MNTAKNLEALFTSLDSAYLTLPSQNAFRVSQKALPPPPHLNLILRDTASYCCALSITFPHNYHTISSKFPRVVPQHPTFLQTSQNQAQNLNFLSTLHVKIQRGKVDHVLVKK